MGAVAASASLATAAAHWPSVDVVRRAGVVDLPGTSLDDDAARFPLAGVGALVVERAARRCVFTTPRPLSDDELVHPFLAPVGASFAWWAGREAFHAGGFVADGGAWGVIGERGSGKSSLLAWLATSGVDVVCDDMLVVDGATAMAGPRCVDLRAPAAERFGLGERLTIAGPRERWRVTLPPTAPELPLRGWVFLEWGDAVDLERLPVPAGLVRLAANRSMMVPPRRPDALLHLSALPAWAFSRPKDWSALSVAVERLLAMLAS